MSGPVRSKNIGHPIRVFKDIPAADLLEAVNALINDLNSQLANLSTAPNPEPVPNSPPPLATTTLAGLALILTEGQIGYATDGRKVGEGPGAGTGVPVYMLGGKIRERSPENTVLI